MNFDGILLVDKPFGWSSFDVVAKTKGILQAEYLREHGVKKKVKVGHTGTLDPLSTGLMIVVIGSYCKRAAEFSKLDKTYEVQMKLGQVSSTGDEEGEKTNVSVKQPTESEVNAAIAQFIGEISQVPPAFSAIKVNGQRAYNLARQGKEVTIEPRTVTIHGISTVRYIYPFVEFVAEVSSGTYIRTLVEDIGKQLGTGAYMSALRRTTVGEFTIADASTIDDVTSAKIQVLE